MPRTLPLYARLPQAPATTSPVPELTGLYHKHDPGPYGGRRPDGVGGWEQWKKMFTGPSPTARPGVGR